jgi:hypothetical protein
MAKAAHGQDFCAYYFPFSALHKPNIKKQMQGF